MAKVQHRQAMVLVQQVMVQRATPPPVLMSQQAHTQERGKLVLSSKTMKGEYGMCRTLSSLLVLRVRLQELGRHYTVELVTAVCHS